MSWNQPAGESCRPPWRVRLRVPPDGLKNPLVRGAPAQHGCHRLLNLRVRRVRCPIAKGLRGHDDAVDAEPALHGLFVDEGLLERVRIFRRPEAFERRDLGGSKGAEGGDTRPYRTTADVDGARSALG